MSIKHLRSRYGVSNKWIAEKLGYKTVKTFTNSPNKQKIEDLLVGLYHKIKEEL